MPTDPLYLSPARAGQSKSSLATLYFPELTLCTARRNLNRWISENPELLARLKALGYRKAQHYYTPSQVAEIFSALGEP